MCLEKNKYIIICYSIRQIMTFITYLYLYHNREDFFNRTTVTLNLIILLLKKVCSARLRKSDIHPISPMTPAPQYQPIDRKKRKIAVDYSRDRAA